MRNIEIICTRLSCFIPTDILNLEKLVLLLSVNNLDKSSMMGVADESTHVQRVGVHYCHSLLLHHSRVKREIINTNL